MSRISIGLVIIGLTSGMSATAAPPEVRSGFYRGQAVTYALIDGRPVLEGDILLDHLRDRPDLGPRASPKSVGIAYPAYNWPKVAGVAQIPYVVTQGSDNLTTALAQFNATFPGIIQFVPRGTEADYVNFDFDTGNQNGVCESFVGRVGGEQQVGGSIVCSVGTLLHEMGHVVGLYHEMSRPDRNSYVTFNYGNVIKGSISNFNQLVDNYQDLGLFDYASVMNYTPFAFTRNGGPTLESIPAGIPLSNTVGYTSADIDGITRLYGAVPTMVTIDTNPTGLQVIVDGKPYTAPQRFNWALNSEHDLNLPAGAQTLDGTNYAYGRWNDRTPVEHHIQITPGGGTLAAPTTSPAVTVYTANFIELVGYSASVYPAGAGTVSASPPAVGYPGITGSFYVARQPVTLTATANAGYGFLEWSNTSAPWSANPKTEPGPGTIAAYFSSQPITSLVTNPPGLAILVDGNYWYGPQNFASDYFPGWTAGSTHTVSAPSPQLPYSINTRYLFAAWSDKGAETHSIKLSGKPGNLIVRYTPEFAPVVYADPSCGSAVTLSPASADGFYRSGTSVKVTAPAATGWVFAGWQYDLTGSVPTKTLDIIDEELAVANYDTTNKPLAIGSLVPASLPAGTGATTVTINGTGFTASTYVYVNDLYRAATFVNSKQMTVGLTAADLAVPGAFPIAVGNFPASAPCGVYVPAGFFVTD